MARAQLGEQFVAPALVVPLLVRNLQSRQGGRVVACVLARHPATQGGEFWWIAKRSGRELAWQLLQGHMPAPGGKQCLGGRHPVDHGIPASRAGQESQVNASGDEQSVNGFAGRSEGVQVRHRFTEIGKARQDNR